MGSLFSRDLVAPRARSQKLARPEPRAYSYWQAWHEQVSRAIAAIDRDLAPDPESKHEVLNVLRRLLARSRWNISKRISDRPEVGANRSPSRSTGASEAAFGQSNAVPDRWADRRHQSR